MRTHVMRIGALLVAAACAASTASAQDADLASGGAELYWHGTATGAHAGAWLDLGPLNSSDDRRDLVIGAPGDNSSPGHVYVLFSGPEYTGDRSLSLANVTITGASNGDGFGTATAIGPVTVKQGTSTSSNLVVGAPNAMGGRGVVYVFAPALTDGTLTTSDAIYTVVGAPGDHLGAALATADINGDGFRELVMGAPGNGHVYIVVGGSGLSGTRDLSTTGADATVNGSGIGSYLAAGDLNGDGLYSILIGAPTQNAVYMLSGRYAAQINLPQDATCVFSGIDPGDAVGASLKIADFDGDGRKDLVIGAPGGDGPGNSRANAGEAYVLWGRSSWTSMSLANADVTFYGAAAGDSVGDVNGLSAGDINRDTPNDLVLVTSDGSAGEALVFYGGSRTRWGTDVGGGRRVVDLAAVSADRRVVGDPSSGRITNSIVYEVTGEGARDVVVAVPSDTSNTGKVAFTISPALKASPSSVSVTVESGQQTNAGVVLENPSNIPISWQVTSDQSWLVPSPSSGASLEGSFGSFTAYVSAAGLAPGSYSGNLTFSSTSEHLDMSINIPVSVTVTPASNTPPPSSDPTPTPHANDFNGDGHMDLVFRNISTGDIAIWTMNGTSRIGSTMPNPPHVGTGWRLAAIGDLNGDNKPDLVWQNIDQGDIYVWYMDGMNRIGSGYLSIIRPSEAAWHVVTIADMNNDGNPDLVLQNQNNGSIQVWMLSGSTVTSQVGTNPGATMDTAWEIVGSGDFNGDGIPDLLWRHRTQGYLIVWTMNGVNRVSTQWLNPGQIFDLNWQIAAVGDVNGDGKPDIIFQHVNDGQLAAWLMDGTTRTSFTMLTPGQVLDTNWRIAGPK